jgi:uncharacterized membrane protein YeaQ/YmgE (transglycosylase-associated protein family)
VVSVVLHYGLKYYVTPGLNSFFSKIIISWIGAWVGSPVFGHWWDGLNYGQLYFIPAILGSLAALVLAVEFVKTWASASKGGA